MSDALDQLIKCSNCGTMNGPDVKYCIRCGTPLHAPPAAVVDSENALRAMAFEYMKANYRLIWRDSRFVQLVKPKQFDAASAIFFGLVIPILGALLLPFKDWNIFGIGAIGLGTFLLIASILVYLGKQDSIVLVYIGVDGQVKSMEH